MAHGHRRHIRSPAVAVGSVVTWGMIGLGAGCGLLIGFGVSWVKALLGTVGLLVILLVAYALERAGLMRPPRLDQPVRPGLTSSASGEPPREPPREPPML